MEQDPPLPQVTTANVKLLVFDDELLSRTRAGTLWGRIYFEFDHQIFPGEGWSALAAAFVAAWLEAVTRIATATTKTEMVRFMDGPVAVAISTGAQGYIKLDFLHRDVVKHSVVAWVEQVLRNSITAAEELVAICNQRGWSGDSDYSRVTTDVDKATKSLPVCVPPSKQVWVTCPYLRARNLATPETPDSAGSGCARVAAAKT